MVRIHKNESKEDFRLREQKYDMSGLRHDRSKVRRIDAKAWHPFKKVIDPDSMSQVHHVWIENTADYTGIAIVDTSITKIHEDAEVMLDGYFNVGAKTGVCELCGEQGKTHWHHPDGRVSVLAMFACLEVCAKCHKQIEHMTMDKVIAYHKGIRREQRQAEADYLGGNKNGI